MDFWQGPHIRLRAVEPSDAEMFFEWNRDAEMNRNLEMVWPPGSLARQQRWAEKTATQDPTGDAYFCVLENEQGEAAGIISTHRCDRRAGTFMYGVAVRREHQRKGYASEAILLILRYFFEELRYQKVTIDVHSRNLASIRLHERLGFQLEGRLRRMVYTEGQYFDELLYGLTAEEFHALHAGSLRPWPRPEATL